MKQIPPLWQNLMKLVEIHGYGEFKLYFQNKKLVRFERMESHKDEKGIDLESIISNELEVKNLSDE